MNGVAIGKSRVARRQGTRTLRPMIELMEDRVLLATFTVTNNADGGPGSLRQAILNANTAPGKDTINFNIGVGAISEFALPAGTFNPDDDFFPFGITAGPNNTVFLTMPALTQLGAYNVTGSFLSTIPVTSPPTGVAADSNGNLWVTETAANIVEEVSPPPAGTILATVSLTGAAAPKGITLGPDGNMYVAEFGTS